MNCQNWREPLFADNPTDAYVGMELAVVPVFQSEIVPKQVRGLIVETYQLMLYVSWPARVEYCNSSSSC